MCRSCDAYWCSLWAVLVSICSGPGVCNDCNYIVRMRLFCFVFLLWTALKQRAKYLFKHIFCLWLWGQKVKSRPNFNYVLHFVRLCMFWWDKLDVFDILALWDGGSFCHCGSGSAEPILVASHNVFSIMRQSVYAVSMKSAQVCQYKRMSMAEGKLLSELEI